MRERIDESLGACEEISDADKELERNSRSKPDRDKEGILLKEEMEKNIQQTRIDLAILLSLREDGSNKKSTKESELDLPSSSLAHSEESKQEHGQEEDEVVEEKKEAEERGEHEQMSELAQEIEEQEELVVFIVIAGDSSLAVEDNGNV